MDLKRKQSYYSYFKVQVALVLVITALLTFYGVRDAMPLRLMSLLLLVMLALLITVLLLIRQRKHHPDKLIFSKASIILYYLDGKEETIPTNTIESIRKTVSYRPGVFPADVLINLKQGGHMVIQSASLIDKEGKKVDIDSIIDYAKKQIN